MQEVGTGFPWNCDKRLAAESRSQRFERRQRAANLDDRSSYRVGPAVASAAGSPASRAAR